MRGVLETLQGFSSSLFYWDDDGKRFRAKTGIYVTHLSQTSLHAVVNQFMYAATCLQLVGILVTKIEKWVRSPPPTLRAFACSASAWLRVRIWMVNHYSENTLFHFFFLTCFCRRDYVILL